ncbi:retroviral-like aspartic protease family protein [Sphingomonas sp. 28-62-11]|uniref:retroviral-like aspartic protease family protein n=1 Tax=Sphingomonas sp. 28-62-11 TaxID=1970432 RepID=UPI000BD14301|nr:MAG: hypothetical protein B7Y49_07235 [Sphingomonas sp. 28-62-11]
MAFIGTLIAAALALSTDNNLKSPDRSGSKCPVETGWLPINKNPNLGFTVTGKINGYQTQVVIDTGAPVTTISKKLSDTLKIPYVIGQQRDFLNARAQTFQANEVTIDLGIDAFYKQKVEVVDFRDFELLQIPIEAIVGRDLLKYCKVNFDRKSNRIEISDNIQNKRLSRVKTFDENGDNFLYTTVSLNGGEKIKSYLDTGSATGYQVTSDRDGSHFVANGTRITTVPVSSAVAVSVEEIAVIPALSIDKYTVDRLEVNFAR